MLRSSPPHCEMRRKDPFSLGAGAAALTAVLTVPEYYGRTPRFVARLGVRHPRSLTQRQQLRRRHAHKSAESRDSSTPPRHRRVLTDSTGHVETSHEVCARHARVRDLRRSPSNPSVRLAPAFIHGRIGGSVRLLEARTVTLDGIFLGVLTSRVAAAECRATTREASDRGSSCGSADDPTIPS